jgi:hypothetical protein
MTLASSANFFLLSGAQRVAPVAGQISLGIPHIAIS